MKVTVQFDPAVDAHSSVAHAIAAIYGEGLEAGPMFTAAEQLTGTLTCNVAGIPENPLASAAAPGASAPVSAPVVAPVASPTAAGGVELDSAGVPWDARIHSSGLDENGQHKKTAQGRWNKRKGVSDAEVAQVTAELLNLMANRASAAGMTQLPVGGVLGNPVNTPHQVAVPVAGSDDEYEVQPIAPAPLAAPAVIPAPLAVPAVPHDFATLMQYVSANLQTPANPAGKLTQTDIVRICTHFGLVDANGNASVALIQHRPNLVPPVYQSFANQIAAV